MQLKKAELMLWTCSRLALPLTKQCLRQAQLSTALLLVLVCVLRGVQPDVVLLVVGRVLVVAAVVAPVDAEVVVLVNATEIAKLNVPLDAIQLVQWVVRMAVAVTATRAVHFLVPMCAKMDAATPVVKLVEKVVEADAQILAP